MQLKDFVKGLRVTMKDPDDGQQVYGVVTNVYDETIWIQWDDLNDEVKHEADEFADINPAK